MTLIKRSESLKIQVLNIIKNEIKNGELKPGDILTEANIAKKLKISRAPVREAISSLETEGTLSRNADGRLCITKLSLEDIYEMYTLRSIIEGLAIKIAISKFTDEDFTCLDNYINDLTNLTNSDNYLTIQQKCSSIHKYIMHKSQHKRAIEIWEQLNEQFIMLAPIVFSFESVEESIAIHSNLIKVLKEKDPIKAEETIKRHILDTYDLVNLYMK